jgi:hypothetical protein
MPISSSISIRGSVGQLGRNDPADVRTIQTRLNQLMKPPRQQLVVDGRSGPKTIGMISDFQKTVQGTPRPDGRVDPNGQTLRALNDPGSEAKWAGASLPPGGAPVAPPLPGGGGGAGGDIVYPPGITARERETLEIMARSAQATRDRLPVEVLNKIVNAAAYGHFKNAMNAVGAAQWAGEFGQAVLGMKNLGLTAEEIFVIFRQFASARNAQGLSQLLTMMKGRPELASAMGKLSKLGTALNVAAVFFAAIEIANHVQAGRIGAAWAEIYGTVMQIAVPWAGLVDAVQGIAYAYAPGLKGSPSVAYFFRLLNAVNPIGAGKTAVDALGTLIETAIVSYKRGTFDASRMNMLVERMKQTPMSVFVEWGDALGDYMGDRFGDFYYEHFLK